MFGNQGAGGSYRLVEYDLDSATIVRTIIDLPDSPTPTSWTLAGSDESGRHLLLLSRFGDSRDLYRWSKGDASPRLVAEGITTADW